MSESTKPRAGAAEWAGLTLLALPTVLLGLDVTVLYLVLPSMSADLNPSPTQELWIMDVYGFLIAGLLITMGTLGDRIGRRRLLVIGVVAFAGASVFAAVAPTAGLLILARALLGVAGATLMPSTLSLISNMFHQPQQRAVAIGIWATMFALGMVAGPVVGGALVDAFWWGAAFLVAVPIAVIVVAGAKALLPEHSDPEPGRLDLVSVALSLATILPIVYAIKHVAADGIDPVSAVLAVVGVVAGVVFTRRQRRLPAPLLDVTLFGDRAFSAALAVLLIGLVGVGGTMYLVTQYLQLVEGMTPFTAGLWMGPPALAMFVAAVGAPLIARRVPPGLVMAATLTLSIGGYALLAVAGVGDTTAVVFGFALVYLGLGAIAALGTDMVVGAAPATKSGSAAAMSEAVQELGVAVGVAVLGSLTSVVYAAHMGTSDGLSAVVAADEVPGRVVEAARGAFTTGVNVAATVAGIAILAAVVLCLTVLTRVRPLGESEQAAQNCEVRLPWWRRRSG
ncbi:DHA2 family multidrug resistance protein-like MFS transporter [Stackebrandtia endophytica]|uniref:DHA2 family multidrug resistance protein-like MFS transporter n=1 Tax=Stackebrandtia endophytica TaxID=1496996 RepID=A0A543B1U6_9ACTN|nr:MFS transporter [Stackebrandtia endophytica]TQL78797.1 DHA2 family multidrug resistance protein-like MFS transporter [Stackebrandtia endophytica]